MRYSVLIAAAATTALGGTPTHRVAPPPPLSAISFMTGCWTGASANGATIEEQYSEAADNMLIGMTRYVRSGRVVDFEFTTVERTDSSFVMTPHPKGVQSDAFPLKDAGDQFRAKRGVGRAGGDERIHKLGDGHVPLG